MKVGHSTLFWYQCRIIFFKFWYHMSHSCPNYSKEDLAIQISSPTVTPLTVTVWLLWHFEQVPNHLLIECNCRQILIFGLCDIFSLEMRVCWVLDCSWSGWPCCLKYANMRKWVHFQLTGQNMQHQYHLWHTLPLKTWISFIVMMIW